MHEDDDVEIIQHDDPRAAEAGQAAIDAVVDLAERLGLEPIHCVLLLMDAAIYQTAHFAPLGLPEYLRARAKSLEARGERDKQAAHERCARIAKRIAPEMIATAQAQQGALN